MICFNTSPWTDECFCGHKEAPNRNSITSCRLFCIKVYFSVWIVGSVCKQTSAMWHSAIQWSVFLLHMGIAKSLTIQQISALGTSILLWCGSANNFKNNIFLLLFIKMFRQQWKIKSNFFTSMKSLIVWQFIYRY